MRAALEGLGLWWGAVVDLARPGPYRTAIAWPFALGTFGMLAAAAFGAGWAGPAAAAWGAKVLRGWLSAGWLLEAMASLLGTAAAIFAALAGGLLGWALAQVVALPWLEQLATEELGQRAPALKAEPSTGWRVVGEMAYGLVVLGLDLCTTLGLVVAAYAVGFVPVVGAALTAIALAAIGGLFVARQASDPAFAALRIPWRGRWTWMAKTPGLTVGFVLGGTLLTLLPFGFLALPALSALAGSRYIAASASQAATTR